MAFSPVPFTVSMMLFQFQTVSLVRHYVFDSATYFILVSSVLLTIWITNRPEHQPLLSSKRIWDLSNNECISGFKRAGWGWWHRYGSWGEVVIKRATQCRWQDPFLIHTLQFIAMPLLWSQLAHTSEMQMQKNVIPAPKALESRILPPHSVEKRPLLWAENAQM